MTGEVRAKEVALKMSRGELLTPEERPTGEALTDYLRVAKAADGDHAAIMFYPQGEALDALAAIMPGGNVAKEDLHMTLIYLGEPTEDGGEWDLELIAAACKLWSRSYGAFDAEVAGIGRFVNGGDTDAIVALIDSEDATCARDSLWQYLCFNCAVPMTADAFNPEHGFIPHITLSYEPKGNAAVSTTIPVEGIEFKVDSIRLGYGDMHSPDMALGTMYDTAQAEEAPEQPSDYYEFAFARAAEVADTLAKAGRVVSRTNMTKLETAIQALQGVVDMEVMRRAAEAGDEEEDIDKAVNSDIAVDDLTYMPVQKGTDEWRYTFGPLYSPDRKDAHGEYVVESDLHKATINFMQDMVDRGDNRLFLQHGDLGQHYVGRIVEMAALPFEHTVKMRTGAGEERELTFPKGTAWVGTVWDEDAWPLVKSGKINGYSMGGRALKVPTDVDLSTLEYMGDKLVGDPGPETLKALDAMRALVSKATGNDEPTDIELAEWAEGLVAKADKLELDEAAEIDKAALDADAERNEAALALARAAGREEGREQERSLLGKALDLFSAKNTPDVHVHLPEQNVIINEAAATDDDES